MSTNQPSSPKFNGSLLWRIYALAAPYRAKLWIAIILTVGIAFLGPYRPYLMQMAIDTCVAQSDYEGLLSISLLIATLLLLQVMMQLWNTILSNAIGQHVIYDLRMRVYTYLNSLRLRFYDKTPVGTLVTRSTSDIETIADVFSEGLINISGDILQIVFILILMFSSDWQLSLVSLSVLPLLLYAGYVFKEKVRVSFEEVRNEVARLNTFVQERIQGMQIVQLFNREKEELKAFERINASHRDANIRSIFYYSVFFPVVEILAAISVGLIVWYGAHELIELKTSVGTIIAFIMYINMFFRPIRQVADRFNTLQMGMVASERIFKLIDDSSPIESDSGKQHPPVKGKIEFVDVTFSYKPDEPILKGVSFLVQPGKTLAIIGTTGAGKSTIVHLLTRFYEKNDGKILIDDIEQEAYTLNQLRSEIGMVLQDVFLFSGSVLDNIRLFNTNISEEEVVAAAKKIGAHAFIENLPNGYQQQVQERGLTLSVGQRQLISFVRAMVYNPKILVLDEATSSIDHQSELAIQKAIEVMMQHRTCIVIAHRLSTIQHADEIIVLDKGEIIERGKHNELMSRNMAYANLVKMQIH